VPRLLIRCNAELAAQRVGAEAVLPKGISAPPRGRIDLHECAMGRLLETVEAEQPECRVLRRVVRAGAKLPGEEISQDRDRRLVQRDSFGDQPRLEFRLIDDEVVEQRSPIEQRGVAQRRLAPISSQPGKGVDIHLYRTRPKADTVGVQDQQSEVTLEKQTTEQEQRLPQAAPRLLLRALPPE
jgi:hypothetical protein